MPKESYSIHCSPCKQQIIEQQFLNVVLSLKELTVTANSKTGVTAALVNSKLLSSNF
jgi:hypothetical protein